MEGFSNFLVVCDDGKDYEESFKILSGIFTDIFPDKELRKLTVSKKRAWNTFCLRMKVTTALLGNKKCALFEVKEMPLLVERESSAVSRINDWLQEIKPIVSY